MATKKDKKADPKAEEKAAKRKARMEAIKNRPAGQRPNSKQIDVIQISEKAQVMNFGYPVKSKEGNLGVLVTSVTVVDGVPTSSSVTFVPGKLTVKAKKGHGVFATPKVKKGKGEAEEETEESED